MNTYVRTVHKQLASHLAKTLSHPWAEDASSDPFGTEDGDLSSAPPSMCQADVQDAVVAQPKMSGKDSYDADVLAPEDAWIAKFDADAFKEDVRALGKELANQQGPADLVSHPCSPSGPRSRMPWCPVAMVW